jgi:hypothetical protein
MLHALSGPDEQYQAFLRHFQSSGGPETENGSKVTKLQCRHHVENIMLPTLQGGQFLKIRGVLPAP